MGEWRRDVLTLRLFTVSRLSDLLIVIYMMGYLSLIEIITCKMIPIDHFFSVY